MTYYPPEQLCCTLPGDVAYVLLTAGKLDAYRRAHRGDNLRVDAALQAMTLCAIRYREATRNGQPTAPTPDTDTQSLLTTEQAADRCGTSARTIRRRIESGQLSAVRAGHFWLIPQDMLNQYKTECND